MSIETTKRVREIHDERASSLFDDGVGRDHGKQSKMKPNVVRYIICKIIGVLYIARARSWPRDREQEERSGLGKNLKKRARSFVRSFVREAIFTIRNRLLGGPSCSR